MYARKVGDCDGHVEQRRERYRETSCEWHRFFGFEGSAMAPRIMPLYDLVSVTKFSLVPTVGEGRKGSSELEPGRTKHLGVRAVASRRKVEADFSSHSQGEIRQPDRLLRP